MNKNLLPAPAPIPSFLVLPLSGSPRISAADLPPVPRFTVTMYGSASGV